jgi:RNA polymerase sigma factor (sigma-70 family)
MGRNLRGLVDLLRRSTKLAPSTFVGKRNDDDKGSDPVDNPGKPPDKCDETARAARVHAELGVSEAELRRYLKIMAALARRMSSDRQHVDDIVNDAFVVVCSKEKGERPDPKNEAAYLAWLCAIVYWTVKTNVRRRARRSREQPTAPDELEDFLEGREDTSGVDLRGPLGVAFATLRADEIAIFEKHVLEGASLVDIAAARGEAYTAVHSRFHRSIGKLRRILIAAGLDPRAPGGRAALVPLVVFAFLAREARAQAGALWGRIKAALVRAPIRFAFSGGMAAAVLGFTPHEPRAEGETGERLPVHAVHAEFTTGGTQQQAQGMRRVEPIPTPIRLTTPRRETPVSKPAGSPPPAERSPLLLMAVNAQKGMAQVKPVVVRKTLKK